MKPSSLPSFPFKDQLSRLRTARPRLLILLAAGAGAGLLWAVLRSLTRARQTSPEWQLFLLLLAALLSLWIGLGGLALLLRRRGRSLADIFSLPLIFALAYLIPALVFVLPGWVSQSRAQPAVLLPGGVWGPAGLVVGQPWYYLWQALMLAASSFVRKPQFSTALPHRTALHWRVTAALLAGLVIWLAAAFVYGLLASPFSAFPEAPLPLLQIMVLVVATLIAPWGEERFFRGELLPRQESAWGHTPAVLVNAALFATVQLRPLLWLPAFVVGLLLAELTLRTRRLVFPILAHALCNLLFFFLGWYLVL
jgi:membrane protease YdiL (CAAX protease family)